MADENTRNEIPKSLTKYYKCDRYSFSVLKDKKIWASDPLKFNDPFDCAIQFWRIENFPRDFIIGQLNELDPQVDHENLSIPTLRDKYFKNLLQIFGVFCLNDGQNEDLFWGYYSDHKGFSIKFDSEKLIDYWGLQPQKIKYIPDNILVNMRAPLSNDKEINNENLFLWLTTKKEDWINEKEWRFIFPLIPDGKEPRKVEFSPNTIKEVILGFKFFEGTNLEYQKRGIFKHTFNSENYNKAKNYHLEILKVLKEQSNYLLTQVVLDENFKLCHLPISIKEINKNEVTIIRHFANEQIKTMDVEF